MASRSPTWSWSTKLEPRALGGVCANHRARPAVERLGARAYCVECRDARARATRGLELRARPSECFATYAGADRWLPIAGGGAAHWLAHQVGAVAAPGRPACAAGFAVERADLLGGRKELRGEPPRSADVWVDVDAEGCGIVVRAVRDETRGFSIAIRHLQSVPARETTGDFYLQLAGRGRFFR